MAFVIDHQIEVAAPAAVVWQVLTDFSAYGDWNPFVVGCECELKVGEKIVMQVILSEGNRPRRQVEYIKELEQGRQFAYVSPRQPRAMLHSHRSHTVTVLDDDRCHYHSCFELHGWLSPVVCLLHGRGLQRGFSTMTQALKARAEATALIL